MKEFLLEGLRKWQALTPEERLPSGSIVGPSPAQAEYPEDGLVLNVILRKLYSRTHDRARGAGARGIVEWNQDFAWFRKAEATRFIPADPAPGDVHEIPTPLVHRLARYHFTNTVRVFCDPYPPRCVEDGHLVSTVLEVEDGLVSVRLEGAVRTWQDDLPRFGSGQGPRQARIPRKPERGYDARLLGYATYSIPEERFTAFELVAYGTLHGGGVREFEDPVRMGVALTLAGRGPIDRVPPHHLSSYGWK
jgi:hypothetical protein